MVVKETEVKKKEKAHLQSLIQTFSIWQNDGPDRSEILSAGSLTKKNEKTRAAQTAESASCWTLVKTGSTPG